MNISKYTICYLILSIILLQAPLLPAQYRDRARSGVTASSLVEAGNQLEENEDYRQALIKYEQAIEKESAQVKPRFAFLVPVLLRAGYCNYKLNEPVQALRHFEEAEKKAKSLKDYALIGETHNYKGLIYFSQNRWSDAVRNFKEATLVFSKAGKQTDIAVSIFKIGYSYYHWEKYSDAVKFFSEAAKRFGNLRKNAPDDASRKALAYQKRSFSYLGSSYIREEIYDKAFQAFESGNAIISTECIPTTQKKMQILPYTKVQEVLGEDQAIVILSNSTTDYLSFILTTKSKLRGFEVLTSVFTESINEEYGSEIRIAAEQNKHIVSFPFDWEEEFTPLDDFRLVQAVDYYTSLIQSQQTAEARETKYIARKLYDLLIGSIHDELSGIQELIIVPDGVFEYMPFETLLDFDDNFLVEQYDITYLPSASLLPQLALRDYPSDRNAMLAVGNAIFERSDISDEIVTNKAEFQTITKLLYNQNNRGGSTRSAYNALGLSAKNGLDGSLPEIRTMLSQNRDGDILASDRASESELIALSDQNALTLYRYLHFSLPGLIVPSIPEMSGIFCSQFAEERDNHDGILRLPEIAGLHLEADQVTLTGTRVLNFAKLYSNGSSNLANAWFVAGANGVAFSLWDVDKHARPRIFSNYLSILRSKQGNAALSISDLKRQMISGTIASSSSPATWASVVYWGLPRSSRAYSQIAMSISDSVKSLDIGKDQKSPPSTSLFRENPETFNEPASSEPEQNLAQNESDAPLYEEPVRERPKRRSYTSDLYSAPREPIFDDPKEQTQSKTSQPEPQPEPEIASREEPKPEPQPRQQWRRSYSQPQEPDPTPPPRITSFDDPYKNRYEEGMLLFQNRQYNQAIKHFNVMLVDSKTHNLSDNCQYWKALSYYQLENYEIAREEFTKVLNFRNSNKDNDARVMIAKCRAKMELPTYYEEEMLIYGPPPPPSGNEAAVRQYQEEYAIGIGYFESKRYQDAIEHFRNMLYENNSHELSDNCQYWIAESYFQLKNYKQALIEFEKVESYADANKIPDAIFMQARCYQKINQPKNARESYQRALSSDPDKGLKEKIREKINKM